MVDFLNNLFAQIDPLTAYLVLGISAFVENTFPPIPGDTVTVLGAYLTSTGQLSFWGVYVSTTIGSVVGFFTMYLIGKIFGRRFLQSKFRKRFFDESGVEKVEHWFAKYGLWVIVGNRFLSGTRSVISIFAGIFQLNWQSVLLLSTVSAFIWNGILIYAGYQLGVNWHVISGLIGQYNKIVLGLTVLIIGFVVYKKYNKHKQKKQSQSEE